MQLAQLKEKNGDSQYGPKLVHVNSSSFKWKRSPAIGYWIVDLSNYLMKRTNAHYMQNEYLCISKDILKRGTANSSHLKMLCWVEPVEVQPWRKLDVDHPWTYNLPRIVKDIATIYALRGKQAFVAYGIYQIQVQRWSCLAKEKIIKKTLQIHVELEKPPSIFLIVIAKWRYVWQRDVQTVKASKKFANKKLVMSTLIGDI